MLGEEAKEFSEEISQVTSPGVRKWYSGSPGGSCELAVVLGPGPFLKMMYCLCSAG